MRRLSSSRIPSSLVVLALRLLSVRHFGLQEQGVGIVRRVPLGFSLVVFGSAMFPIGRTLKRLKRVRGPVPKCSTSRG